VQVERTLSLAVKSIHSYVSSVHRHALAIQYYVIDVGLLVVWFCTTEAVVERSLHECDAIMLITDVVTFRWKKPVP